MELLPCIIFVNSSADPRLLGPYTKLYHRRGVGVGGVVGCNVVIGMKEWMKLTHLSVFHSISNRAHEKRSRNSISSPAQDAFNTFFFVTSKRLYDIHVT